RLGEAGDAGSAVRRRRIPDAVRQVRVLQRAARRAGARSAARLGAAARIGGERAGAGAALSAGTDHAAGAQLPEFELRERRQPARGRTRAGLRDPPRRRGRARHARRRDGRIVQRPRRLPRAREVVGPGAPRPGRRVGGLVAQARAGRQERQRRDQSGADRPRARADLLRLPGAGPAGDHRVAVPRHPVVTVTMRGIDVSARPGAIARIARLTRAALIAVGLLAPLTGCSAWSDGPGYSWQSVSGHLAVMRQARPIEAILDDPSLDEALRGRLRSVVEIRRFASASLDLPDNGSYTEYADLRRPFVVWNVFATPELSLRLEEWCFPVAGCVGYRGYYDQHDAERLAERLRAEGYEAFVRGVPAYSTLGWFDDPVLNTFIRYPVGELARLIFHELAHQVLYVK